MARSGSEGSTSPSCQQGHLSGFQGTLKAKSVEKEDCVGRGGRGSGFIHSRIHRQTSSTCCEPGAVQCWTLPGLWALRPGAWVPPSGRPCHYHPDKVVFPPPHFGDLASPCAKPHFPGQEPRASGAGRSRKLHHPPAARLPGPRLGEQLSAGSSQRRPPGTCPGSGFCVAPR